MKKNFTLSLILMTILFILPCYAEEYDADKIKESIKSTVIIKVKSRPDFIFVDETGLQKEELVDSLGSGVILSSDGIIVTNTYIISGASEIIVITSDKKKFNAKVLIEDKFTTLALIKIEANNLNPITFGNHISFAMGDDCWAIGNSMGEGISVTKGIISSKDLIITHHNLIERNFRFSAKVSPGNSGGALVDKDGKLIGIPSIKYHQGSKGEKVYDFNLAIPVYMVKKLYEKYLESNSFKRSWIRCSVLINNEKNRNYMDYDGKLKNGFLVEWRFPNSAGEKCKLQRNDLILTVNGLTFFKITELQDYIFNKEIGTELEFKILRKNKEKIIKIQTEELIFQPEEISWRFWFFHLLGLEFDNKLRIINIAKGSSSAKLKLPKGKIKGVVPGQFMDVMIAVNINNSKDLQKAIKYSFLAWQFGIVIIWSNEPEDIIMFVTDYKLPFVL